MPNVREVHTISALLHTGSGHVAGLVASSTSDNMAVSIRDGLDDAAPMIFSMAFNASHPVIIFFNDRFSPRFHEGCYLAMTDPVQVTIWLHEVDE
jgi:hypothetical protein